MKKLFPILLIVILSLSKDRQCVAQNFSPEEQHQIDSLNAIINNPNSHDTSIAGAYVGLSEILYISNIDTLNVLCNKSKKIAESGLKKSDLHPQIVQSYKKSLARSVTNIAYTYVLSGEIERALENYKLCLILSREISDYELIAYSLNNIGYLYNHQGDISNALQYYSESLKIQEEIGDDRGIAISLNNIAAIYDDQDDNKKAIEYYNRSYLKYKTLKDKRGMAESLNNIAYNYSKQSNYDLALDYNKQSLLLKEEIGDTRGIAGSLINIGVIYDNQNKLDEAIDYYERSLHLFEKINDKSSIAKALGNLGKSYLNKGEVNKAFKFANKGLSISQEVGFPDNIKNISKVLEEIHSKKGAYKEALEMYKLHIQMRDSLNNEETQKAAAKQQAQYEYEKQKAVDDAEHEKQIAIEQEAKEKQQIITYATAGGLGLVAIFLVFVFNRLQVTKKQKVVIEGQKQEVEQQKEVVELAHHELEEKNQEIMDSITYAKRIQNAILPPLKLVKEYLQESFILYKPKDIVAGDFYWLEHKEDIILFAAADCTGHGVPGAMVSVVCNNGLNRSVREYGLTDPGEILNKTREIVIAEFEKSEEEVKDGMDIALCSLEGNILKYAGANNPLWIIRDGEIIETKADKQPIGKFDELLPYKTHTFELQKGDSIYIFSDGYVDQFGGEKGKKFKAKAFRELLLSIQETPMEEQKTKIDNAFENWRGNLEQIDDVCVIGVRI
ncbi:tetratricopeptide repeat protein [Vicingus serpentipes]|uniref:Tetratricopeptide repeat protein n=1 Tax=Vicingus serpentipes TaxID=1926625 RepID=A0A5C6RRK8_9FLAO|nr:tetratricopeptide repeat protein [Vicingus serpentipes]TXB64797.1 tetratricopeptide repeat protein [Vicingus serpentipes]